MADSPHVRGSSVPLAGIRHTTIEIYLGYVSCNFASFDSMCRAHRTTFLLYHLVFVGCNFASSGSMCKAHRTTFFLYHLVYVGFSFASFGSMCKAHRTTFPPGKAIHSPIWSLRDPPSPKGKADPPREGVHWSTKLGH